LNKTFPVYIRHVFVLNEGLLNSLPLNQGFYLDILCEMGQFIPVVSLLNIPRIFENSVINMKKYIFKLYPFETETPNKDDSIFPDPIRCLIVGGSGSDKTTLLRNIITEYWVDYQHLYVFTKNLEQPVYIISQKIFDINFKINSHFSAQDIVPVNKCQTNSLVVFDVVSLYFINSNTFLRNLVVIYFINNDNSFSDVALTAKSHALINT
jgi:hypothetical protein